jgi:S1-C subfamily serine protease
MREWMANLLGLAIGFAVGGAVLVHYLPQLEAMRPAPEAAAQRRAEAPPLPRVVRPHTSARRTAPARRTADVPSLAPLPLDPLPAPLPQVVTPGVPGWREPSPEPQQGGGKSGTGFFIAEDGTLLTAAHVVSGCRRMQVVSRSLGRVAAKLLATDDDNDIALLRAEHVHAPAVLPLGRPAGATARLFVIGYPATAGLTTPEETWATLENARLPHGAGSLGDPRFMVWFQASAVRHGYSGGPVLDPRSGAVVALVKGTLAPEALHRLHGMPDDGVAIGPGAGRLRAFVENEDPGIDVTAVAAQGDDAVALARRATVHVLCWY